MLLASSWHENCIILSQMRKNRIFTLSLYRTYKGEPLTLGVCAKLAIWAGVALLLLSGCAHTDATELSTDALPEEVYLTPEINDTRGARVAIYAFPGPDYAQEMGHLASEILCNALEKSRAFREVISQPRIDDMTLGNLVNVARIKRFDLIIVGRLLTWFEGTGLEPSRVREEIRVISVRGGRPRVLWHAAASEAGSPERSTDYIFFLSDGSPAPSPAALMKMNAEKFCNMILTLPPQQ
jgi:hypothetical protein